MNVRWLSPFLATVALAIPQANAAPAASARFDAASSRVSDEAFELSLRPVGPYRAGRAAKAEIVLVAKSGYKVNDKYPTKFKFASSSQLKPEAEVVQQDAFQIEGHRAVMTLRFTPQSAGQKQLAGEFKFSVCTKDRCLVEKRELAVTLDVE